MKLISILFVSLLLIPQTPTLTATVEGSIVKVSWTSVGRPANDWVGVFKKGTQEFVDWVYISGSRVEGALPAGSKDFTVQPGEYDVRYLQNSQPPYTTLATAAVTIGVVTPDPVEPLPDPVQPLPPVQTVRVLRVTVFKADGTV